MAIATFVVSAGKLPWIFGNLTLMVLLRNIKKLKVIANEIHEFFQITWSTVPINDCIS